jgi:hypothetical protein
MGSLLASHEIKKNSSYPARMLVSKTTYWYSGNAADWNSGDDWMFPSVSPTYTVTVPRVDNDRYHLVIYTLTYYVCGYRQNLDGYMHLLTIYTHYSEFHIITAL